MLSSYRFKIVKRKITGFTLIELLVVISIIGLLAIAVMFTFQHQRAKTRDTKRLADLNQLKTALELYYASVGTYPIIGGGNASIFLGSAPVGDTTYKCLSDAPGGFEESCTENAKIFMASIPKDPLSDSQYYFYQSDMAGNTYGVNFELELSIDSLTGGSACLTPNGFVDGSCE